MLLFLLTKLQLILLSAQKIGTDKLLSTQFDSKSDIRVHAEYGKN